MTIVNINFKEFVFKNEIDIAIINDANWIISTRKSNLSLMTEGEKTITLILKLNGEVGNGGFEQYFYNTQGHLIRETINSLMWVNDSSITIFEEAIETFQSDKDESTKEEEWDKLDKQFYKCDNNLYKLMVAYIKNNIEQFV
ncbi:recombinational DNA repair protein (RecF pathway) [Metabacillus crassostreae]|uniref:DMP19 family protein n=1 Tax=Metabacillus crassostreae TaxID=929098 RepID=UPI0019591759|nr:DUF4375 domain-containing protein [Metabacillus crassostreae]MBM7602606.1 recombinational DNA repair protein (RecF pathway) [Metabacillus crassostreae]